MSLVDRCDLCDALVTRCRCDANPNPIHRPSFIEQYEGEREQWDVRVRELPNGRFQVAA